MGLVVSGFNFIARGVTSIASYERAQKVLGGIENFEKDVSFLKPLKDRFIKPLIAAASSQKFYYGQEAFEALPTTGLKLLGMDMNLIKSWASVPDFMTSLPRLVKSFTPISETADNGDVIRKVLVDNTTSFHEQDGVQLSKTSTVFKRLFSVASSVIGLADLINCVTRYVGTTEFLKKVIPWSQVAAGTYMGVQALAQEATFRRYTDFSTLHPSENYLSWSAVAMNMGYLSYSVVGAATIYLGEEGKKYPLLSRCQIASQLLYTFAPLVHSAAKSYRDSFVNAKPATLDADARDVPPPSTTDTALVAGK
jgi:hypothetical protein